MCTFVRSKRFGNKNYHEMQVATVTVKFETRQQAETFATLWARRTKRGHIVGSGTENVEVILHDVTPDELEWVKQLINE